jgi:acyl-CoA synthetase (AMP-forming)/AMP-acid ligase II
LYPGREAVVDGELRLTYEQLFARCDRWSFVLQRLGVRQGDRVAYISANTHAQLESFYAVPQIGAVLVPINYRLIAEDFAYIIGHSGAKVVCAAPEHLEAIDAVRERLSGVAQFVALEGAGSGWLDYEAELAAVPGTATVARPGISEGDLLTINYTSGTTARPKGVMITHRNAYLNAVGTLVHVHMTPADRYLWTLPMFHANGWTFVWIVTAVGGTHVCLRKVEPARIFAELERESVTMLCAAPTVLIGIANAPEELRRGARHGVRVLTAGAPPAAATIARVEGELGWDITHVYGLTETAPFITISEPRPEHAGLSPADRAVIKARQGVELVTSGELLVVDEAGHEVPHDGQTVGEIVVRGNVVMKGYFEDPEASVNALRGGYFHSGDAAVVHPDGFAEVRDRIKDVIISGGENISSVEVEGVLLSHAAVQEVAVVGIANEKWGEAPHAFVILRAGASATEAELRTFVRNHLAHFKCPQAFHFVTELPKTATGKVQKFVLRGRKAGISTQ